MDKPPPPAIPGPAIPAPAEPKRIVPADPATAAFVKGLVERGEAARPDAAGKLPAGATHEIVGDGPDGLPIVVRRRFNAF